MTRARSHFFEIPIYSGPPDTLEEFLVRRRSRWLAPLEEVRDFYPRTYARALEKFERCNAYPPHFNDQVGAIGLRVSRGRVCGDLYFTAASSVRRGGHQRILDRGKLFQSPRFEAEARRAIYESVHAALREAIEDAGLEQRWVDLGAFERSGPLLDWRSLLRLGRREAAAAVPAKKPASRPRKAGRRKDSRSGSARTEARAGTS